LLPAPGKGKKERVFDHSPLKFGVNHSSVGREEREKKIALSHVGGKKKKERVLSSR